MPKISKIERVAEGECLMGFDRSNNCDPKCDRCGFNKDVAARRMRIAKKMGLKRDADGLWGYHYPPGV